MVAGIIKFDIYMEGNTSLKDKRRQIKSIIGKTKSRFPNISIAEVGFLDKWNKSTLGFSMVSNEASFVDSKLDQAFFFVQQISDFFITNKQKEVIHF